MKNLVQEMSSRVNNLSKNSVENLLEIGKIFFDGKSNLTTTEYKQFLQETHYVEGSSTVRKWEQIGKSYTKFQEISNLLPPVFSTLYQLTKLTDEELKNLVNDKKLKPSTTSQEIDEYFQKPSNNTKSLPKIVIEFTDTVTFNVVKEIDDMLQKYSNYIEIKKNDEVKEYISMSNNVNSLVSTETV